MHILFNIIWNWKTLLIRHVSSRHSFIILLQRMQCSCIKIKLYSSEGRQIYLIFLYEDVIYSVLVIFCCKLYFVKKKGFCLFLMLLFNFPMHGTPMYNFNSTKIYFWGVMHLKTFFLILFLKMEKISYFYRSSSFSTEQT